MQRIINSSKKSIFMSQTHIIFIVTVAVLLLVGGVWFVRGSSDEAILSRSGIHWHPRIEIIVGDKKRSGILFADFLAGGLLDEWQI